MRWLQRWLLRRLRPKPYPPKKLLRYMRIYPPLLFQRIIPLAISEDYLSVHVKVRRSLLNRNLNGSFFGGTILAAVDLWYGTLLWQKCLHAGIPLEVWVEELQIRFIKASRGDLYLTCSITPQQWTEIYQALTTEGKLRYSFSYQVYGTEGYLCVEGTQVLYLRNLALRPRKKNRAPSFS